MREDEVEYLPNRLKENLSDAADDDATVVVPFQNENLCAYMEKNDGTRTVNIFLLLDCLAKLFFERLLGFSCWYR